MRELGLVPTLWPDERIRLDIDTSAFEAVICNSLFVHNDIRQFDSLRYIQLTSAGMDRVPLGDIEERGIELRTAAGVYSVPIAESAVAGILGIYRHLSQFLEKQRAHQWLKDRALLELAGRTACVVGTGSVGREVAKRLRAFDVSVVGVRRSSAPAPGFNAVVDVSHLDAVLAEADIVVIALPLSADTSNMFDAARIAKMKPGSLIVNVARGGIVDEQALGAALAAGHLGGAVLDTFESEPLPSESPLWELPNVLITPHNSFVSDKTDGRLVELIVKNLAEYLKHRGSKP